MSVCVVSDKTRRNQTTNTNDVSTPFFPSSSPLPPKTSYDFSADFPKLWCEAHMHGSQGERKTKYQRRRRSSATKRVANVYLRFVSAWQARKRSRPPMAWTDYSVFYSF